jgi:hypothetical protein
VIEDRWRFPFEQRAVNGARTIAIDSLGGDVETKGLDG